MSDDINRNEESTEYGHLRIAGPGSWLERREHRRHDMEQQGVAVERFDGRGGKMMGRLVDISAGGMRLRTTEANVRADQQIRVRLELPNFAGISPFIARQGETLTPRREGVGWMAVARVMETGEKGEKEVAGRLVDMDDMDRGMLSLYLSTQPLAA